MPEYLTMRNSKILITGGAGFVGSNLCYYLLNKIQPDKIYIVDNLLSSEKINVPLDSKVQFIFGSISTGFFCFFIHVSMVQLSLLTKH